MCGTLTRWYSIHAEVRPSVRFRRDSSSFVYLYIAIWMEIHTLRAHTLQFFRNIALVVGSAVRGLALEGTTIPRIFHLTILIKGFMNLKRLTEGLLALVGIILTVSCSPAREWSVESLDSNRPHLEKRGNVT